MFSTKKLRRNDGRTVGDAAAIFKQHDSVAEPVPTLLAVIDDDHRCGGVRVALVRALGAVLAVHATHLREFAPLPGTTSDGTGGNDAADTERMTEQPLPDKGDKDDDSAWGESETADDEVERLERERPPHYDR